MMDFSGSAGAASSFDVIPAGQVAFAILNVKGLKGSASGGGYLDIELTIDEGQPFAGRKVFEMIGDPQNAGNSEKYREMGTIAITRILEAGRGAGPNNLEGYRIQSYEQLSGLRVAVKLKVEAGENGYPDKNKVAEWLTPNPASQSGHKGWQQLASGVFNTAKPAAQAQGGFGGGQAGNTQGGGFGQTGSAQPSQGASSGFGNAAQGGGQQASSGFQQPAGNAASTAGATSDPASSPFAQNATTSPSNPTATPGWLQQAGQ